MFKNFNKFFDHRDNIILTHLAILNVKKIFPYRMANYMLEFGLFSSGS